MGACAADTEARAVLRFRNLRDVYGEWRATEISEAAPEKNLGPAISRHDLFAAAALSSMKVKVFSSANAKTEAMQYDRECARSAWAMAEAMLTADAPKEQEPTKPKHADPSERRYSVEFRKREGGMVGVEGSNNVDFFTAVREIVAIARLSDDFAMEEVAKAGFEPVMWTPVKDMEVGFRIWRTK